MDKQLPAEVQQKIHTDSNMLYDQLDSAAKEVDYYDFGLPQSERQTEPIRNLLTEYATNLHTATQMLFRIVSLVNADQKPDEKFLTEIKTFLDGTK